MGPPSGQDSIGQRILILLMVLLVAVVVYLATQAVLSPY
jgi:hypothetical protein